MRRVAMMMQGGIEGERMGFASAYIRVGDACTHAVPRSVLVTCDLVVIDKGSGARSYGY